MPLPAYNARATLDGPPCDADGRPYVVVAAVFIRSEIGFEYPETARALADGLREAGVAEQDLLEVVGAAADANAKAAQARRVAAPAAALDGGPGEEAAPPGRARPARPSPATGCGALGGPVAEACVRAGARLTTVVDNGVVTPGILVRQPYTDADIGNPKATALAARLQGLLPGAEVRAEVRNAIRSHLRLGQPAPEFDLIVDATADARVRAALERARAARPGDWPPVLTMIVGHRARRGVVAVSRAGATGAGHDVLRRLGIAVRTTHADVFADVVEDLYPREPRTELFLPEPGCSAPTFVGSAVEATALAAGLLSAGLDALSGKGPEPSALPMAVAVVRLDLADPKAAQGRDAGTWIGWPNDAIVDGAGGTLPIRLNPAALSTVRAEARRGVRLRGPRVETGGMLLGQIDEAAGVVFVDVATPPPPDSRLSDVYFEHGAEGAQDLVEHHRNRTNGTTGFVGMWHTHPHGDPRPSTTDNTSMANLVTPVTGGSNRCLIAIFGGQGDSWTGWLDADGADSDPALPEVYARLIRRTDRDSPPPPPRPAPAGSPRGH